MGVGDADVRASLAEGSSAIGADVSGSVWKLCVSEGEHVAAGQTVAILESMKMEVAVTAVEEGVVETIDCVEGAPVVAGQRLMVLKAAAVEESDVARNGGRESVQGEEAACR
jgi:urea carboxylase